MERAGKGRDSRSLRVFISSTFQDMQAEREELVKRVFPRLRKLCESRGVTWGEVDLRWGVTNEQTAEGGVLPICFAEIERCRPLFICFLGHRFGWVPEEIPQALVEQEPWLARASGCSVTELEILHAVLNDRGSTGGSFFYFRSREFIEALPPEDRAQFEEAPRASEVERLGLAEASRLAEERQRRLESLKQRIRESGAPLREDYSDPVAVGEMVYEDLVGEIDRLYPAGQGLDPFDRDTAEQDAFAASRAGIYVGGESYLSRLDAHVAQQDPEGGGRGLVIVGHAGAGKSALLASWVARRAGTQTAPEQPAKSLWRKVFDRLSGSRPQPSAAPLVIAHFAGAAANSSDPTAMLRRLIGELNRQLNLQQEIPEKADALRAAFVNSLHMASAKRRVVLVIDALNQLDQRNRAALAWLPERLPENLRVIVSTLDGPALDELTRRGWSKLSIDPLRPDERGQLIAEFLARYRKALDPDRVRRIEQAEQTGNPLFLRTLLDELRLHGDHWTLDECIDRYLSAPSLDSLFDRVLERYERDFERERPHLVRDAMALLWAARRGLSDDELLELLAADGGRLPQAIWSPVSLAAEAFLVSRAGLISFAHDQLRLAVQRRFLPTAEDRVAAHLKLADYFSARDLVPRSLEELPWQLARAGAWPALYDRLTDLEFFVRAWDNDRLDVKRHWAELEEHSDHRVADAYSEVIRNLGEYVERFGPKLANLATLHFDAGAVEAGKEIGDFLWRHFKDAATPKDTAGHHADRLLLAMLTGQTLSPAEQAAQAVGSGDELTNGDIIQAMVRIVNGEIGSVHALDGHIALLIARGQFDEAMALLAEQERLFVKHRDEAGRGSCLVVRASILSRRGELNDAMGLLLEGERIGRDLGDRMLVQSALGSQGHVAVRRRERERALALFQEQESICRELGLEDDLIDCMTNQATVLREVGQPERALSIFEKAEKRAREVGDKRKVMRALGNQATVLSDRGDLDAAMARFDEVVQMARALDDKSALHTTLGNQGSILARRGELDRALELIEEKMSICRELDDKRGLADGFEKLVLTHTMREDHEAALAYAQEGAELCNQLGDMTGVTQFLFVQGLSKQSCGRTQEALLAFNDAYYLASTLGLHALAGDIDAARLGTSLKIDADRPIESWRAAVKARPTDPEALNDLAIALFQAGDHDGAIKTINEVIRLSPMSPMGYYGLGVIYEKTGEFQLALDAFRAAHQIDPSPVTLDACEKMERALGLRPG